MLTKSNLRLLDSELAKIAETPYFSDDLNEYLNQLRRIIEKTLLQYKKIPLDVSEFMLDHIWAASKFLSGSISKKIPYEIVYGLRKALSSWEHENALITTALIQDKNFYFQGVSSEFYKLANAYTSVNFTGDLVQIALPQIYQHRPLLNVALYHELGHFLDIHHGIVDKSLLSIDLKDNIDVINNHLQEYFADIFAASYVGKAYKNFLLAFAENAPASFTHPATIDRLNLIDSFLEEKQDNIIDLFQNSLEKLGLKKLEIAFSVPDISDAFDNVRPYAIQNEKELHGIFEAGTTYLQKTINSPENIWTDVDEATKERVINNLVEKSIRNYMIIEHWNKDNESST